MECPLIVPGRCDGAIPRAAILSDQQGDYVYVVNAQNVVEQRRIKYDLKTAQKKIMEAGLPPLLAERLAIGR